MVETVNKMTVGERVAGDVLAFYGWSRLPPTNQNWRCEFPDEHRLEGKGKSKVHTTDAVFWYQNPYSAGGRVYTVADLKAWANEKITAGELTDELTKLALTVNCAVRAEHWREHYGVPPGHSPHGLLFVHATGGPMPNFRSSVMARLGELDENGLPPRSHLYVIGPDTVLHLHSVKEEIKRSLNQKGMPEYFFWHPSLSNHAPVTSANQVVTIDEFLSPHIIVQTSEEGTNSKRKFIFYCRDDWTSDEDAEFFLDAVYCRQLLDDRTVVEFAIPAGNEGMELRFVAAKARFDHRFGGALAEKLKAVTCRSYPLVGPTITEGTTGVSQ